MNKVLHLIKVEAAWLLVGAIMLLALACLLPTSVDETDSVDAQNTSTNECFYIESNPDGSWTVTHGNEVWQFGHAVDIASVRYTLALFNLDCNVSPPPPVTTPVIESHTVENTPGPILTLGPSPTPTTVPICERDDIVCTGPILELE